MTRSSHGYCGHRGPGGLGQRRGGKGGLEKKRQSMVEPIDLPDKKQLEKLKKCLMGFWSLLKH